MPRATHYLRPSRHAGFPRRQVYLSVRYSRRLLSGTRRRAVDALEEWSAVSWDGGPGGEKWRSEGAGKDAESWWRWLDGQLARGLCPWVWIDGAVHALSLLGFWERIEIGDYYLSRRDAGDDGRTGGKAASAQAGLCVLEDPPTIILAVATAQRRPFKLCDVRNLGGDRAGAAADRGLGPRAGAEWLMSWIRVVDDMQLGGLRHTAAAQAWHGWRHSYLDEGILIHGDSRITGMERSAIHPGRAEAYHLGVVSGPVTALDASAFYPACASGVELPCRHKRGGKYSIAEVGRACARGWLAIARCRVRCREPCLPCPLGDRTVWPIGEWTVTLCGPEIALARAAESLVSIMWADLYEPGDPCRRYMSALWERRVRGERAGRAVEAQSIKLLMNSLVGKWAARGRCWSDAPGEALLPPWQTCYKYHAESRKLCRYRSIGWHVQREDVEDETAESCPALAAWVYSVGRVRLWEWMCAAGRENVYYVDSDSLYCTDLGAGRLAGSGMVRPGEMGALRVQGVYPTLRIGGIRDYAAPGRTVRAGVPKGGRADDDDGLRYWCPETVREAVDARRRPEPAARLIELRERGAYRHGVVGKDGTVSPLDVGVMRDDGV